MHKFKIKLLYNKEKLFCTKTEMLNFKITVTLAKLDMVASRLVTNGLIFVDGIPVNIQLVTFSLLSIISELEIGIKTQKL